MYCCDFYRFGVWTNLFLLDWLLKVGEYSSSVKTGTLKQGFEIDSIKKVKQEISSFSTNFKPGI